MSYRVWSKFQTKKPDGSFVKLRIQDLPETRIDDAVDLFINHFVNEEVLNKIAGVPRNFKAVEEARVYLTAAMKEPSFYTVICCEDNNVDKIAKIVGASSMFLVEKGLKPEDVKADTEELKTLNKILATIRVFYEQIKELKHSCYYDDAGIVVHPQFRKLGISAEFFKVRGLICMANNVPVAVAIVTSIGGQKSAEKANWRSVLDVDLKTLEQQNTVNFQDLALRKIMIWQAPRRS